SRAALVAGLGALGLALWSVLYWPLVLVGYVAEWLIILLRRLPPPKPLEQQPQAGPDPREDLRRLAAPQPALAPGWGGAPRWPARISRCATAPATRWGHRPVRCVPRYRGCRPASPIGLARLPRSRRRQLTSRHDRASSLVRRPAMLPSGVTRGRDDQRPATA